MTDERHPRNRAAQGSLDKVEERKRIERDKLRREAEQLVSDTSDLSSWDEFGGRIEALWEEVGPFIDLVAQLSQDEAERLFSEKLKGTDVDPEMDYAQLLRMIRMLQQVADLQRQGKLEQLQSPMVAQVMAQKGVEDPNGEVDLSAVIEEVEQSGVRSLRAAVASTRTKRDTRSKTRGGVRRGLSSARRRKRFKI